MFIFSHVFLSFFLLFIPYTAPSSEPPDSSDALKHAQTYYWVGVEEGGNLRAFNRSRSHLSEVERKLQRRPQLPDSSVHQIRRRVESLRQSLSRQEELAHDTFYGVFPLSRLVSRSLFWTTTTNRIYELADDPAVRAVKNASSALRGAVLEQWTSRPQINVVVRSSPPAPSLESEAFYLFNDSPQLYARSPSEVATALSPPARDSLRRGTFTERMVRQLCEAFQVPRLLIATVERTDQVDDVHFYTVRGEIYEQDASEPSQVIAETGFSRDRRGQKFPILFGNIGLLLLALLGYVLLTPDGTESFDLSDLVPPALAFIAGRTLPWASIPLLRTIKPIPETLATFSFWWPLLVGGLLFALLPALVWFLAIRFRIHPQDRAGSFFGAILLGVAAYLLTPLLLWAPQMGWLLLGLMILALLPAAYVLGRVVDHMDQLPLPVGLLPVGISLAAGAAVLHAGWPSLAFLAGISVAGTGSLLWAHGGRGVRAEPERADLALRSSDSIPTDADALTERADAPPYQPFDTFDEAKRRLSPLEDGHTAWLGLTGASGTGKTATARALIAELRETERAGYVLRGTCSEPLERGEPSSYEPFQEALKRHFKIGVLDNPDLAAQHQRINEALDGLFDAFVPFASMLFPSAEASAEAIQSRDEIFRSIRDTLRRLARERPTVLFIDDAQWIDEDSEALLAHLLDAFPEGGPLPLAILVDSRTPDTLEGVGMEEYIVFTGTPSPEERLQILTDGLGLTEDTARLIVDQVAAGPDERGELFWLLEVVKHLARRGHFVRNANGFAFGPSVDPTSLPLPNRLREVLEEQLETFPEYRHPLACAACLGETFQASALKHSLNESRLNVLQLLRGIENDTGFIHDEREVDDEFAFQSSYLLEGVRQHFSISGAGPKDSSVPQLVREYHARAAQALETIYQDTAEVPYGEIADHYYAAGTSFADEGKRACIQAARSSTALFNFDQARTYLRKAQECAEALGEEGSLQNEHLRIDCLEAHTTGANQREVADRGYSYLESTPDAPLALVEAVAQVCYDTARATNDQHYFEKTAELGEELYNRGESPEDRAAGHHFLSLALPPKEDTRDSREQHLRTALSLLNDLSGEDRAAQRLRGRVMNSLAELLSDEHSTEEERQEAFELFQKRISLNENLSLGDRKGLAMTYGGLGRLKFYHGSDYEEAREYFQEDLDLARELDDQEGQVQMHSHLGACALELSDMETARHQYEQSLQKADEWKSQCFALAGLLITCARQEDRQSLHEYGAELETTIDWEKLSGGPAARIEEALDAAAPMAEDADWLRRIRDQLGAET